MTYTSEQLYEIAQAKRRLSRTGHPSTVQRIDLAVENELPFNKIQILYKPQNVKAEKPIPVEITDPPPRSGKGSGERAWRTFAKLVSDMDKDMIDSLSKSDIITILIDKKVISE